MAQNPTAAELEIFAIKTTGDYGDPPSRVPKANTLTNQLVTASGDEMRVRDINITTVRNRIDSQEMGARARPDAAGSRPNYNHLQHCC